jgi:putative membrane protein
MASSERASKETVVEPQRFLTSINSVSGRYFKGRQRTRAVPLSTEAFFYVCSGRMAEREYSDTLASPVSAQSAAEKTGVNSALGISPTTADFVKEATKSGMLEIEAEKLAQQRGRGDVKTFADAMVRDHTKTSNEIKAMISSGAVKATAPTMLASKAQGKLGASKKAKNDFASNYADMQVSAHKGAVSLFERYAKSG